MKKYVEFDDGHAGGFPHYHDGPDRDGPRKMRTYKLWYCAYSQGFRANGCGHTFDQGFIYDESCGWITLEDDEGTIRQEVTVAHGAFPYAEANNIPQSPCQYQPCPDHSWCGIGGRW